jgi:hypothetical protein
MKVETIDNVLYYVWRAGDELPKYQPIGCEIRGGRYNGYNTDIIPKIWDGLYAMVIWPKLINDRAQHQRMIDEAYTHACEKHPKFCNSYISTVGIEFISQDVKRIKQHVNTHKEAHYIMGEELLESCEAYLEGRLTDCLHELAQCGAVVKRMMEYVQEQIDKEESK